MKTRLILTFLVLCSLVAGADSSDPVPVEKRIAELNNEIAILKAAQNDVLRRLMSLEATKPTSPQLPVITVQIGTTMRAGESKPITNTKIYLSSKPIQQLLPGEMANSDGRTAPTIYIIGGMLTAGGDYYKKNMEKILTPIRNSSREGVTDFSGKASFEGIEPGNYFVICLTAMAGGATFQKSVTIESKSTTVALNDSDILEPW